MPVITYYAKAFAPGKLIDKATDNSGKIMPFIFDAKDGIRQAADTFCQEQTGKGWATMGQGQVVYTQTTPSFEGYQQMRSTHNNDSDYWQLDYGWARRGGKWTETTDVMLYGKSNNKRVREVLSKWVSLQDNDEGNVDGKKRNIFYAGGVQGYLEMTDDLIVIYLHSSGQDAFDSLSYYSKKIATFLQAHKCNSSLKWIEGRHDRPDHKLQWT